MTAPPKGVAIHRLRTTALDLPPEYKNPLITLPEAQDPITSPFRAPEENLGLGGDPWSLFKASLEGQSTWLYYK